MLQEPLLGGVVAGQVGRQDLDGHLALQARVVGRVHHPHAAVAEFGADRVRAEGGAWGEGHGWLTIGQLYPRVNTEVRWLGVASEAARVPAESMVERARERRSLVLRPFTG